MPEENRTWETTPQGVPESEPENEADSQSAWGEPWYDGTGSYVWWGRPVVWEGRTVYVCARQAAAGGQEYGWAWRDAQGRLLYQYPGGAPYFAGGVLPEGYNKGKTGHFIAAFFATLGCAAVLVGLLCQVGSALWDATGWYDATTVLLLGGGCFFIAGAVVLRIVLGKRNRALANGILWGAVAAPLLFIIIVFGGILLLLLLLGFTGF